ncbi:acidic phospholipase A2 PA4-like isoform X2 [Varroa destructor]|nr:acidic phospholipase A2 PA4-like isoform X2 [Varroa destructor]
MMNLIVQCMNSPNEGGVDNVGDDTGFLAGLISGIYPGTKWCGAGHRAKNYFDLGLEVELDKCCRAHDHCPIKVGPWALGFGGRNWAFYTISHCDCDTDFFNCLAEVDNQAADTIGVLYFNTMKVPCLRESPQVKLCPPATSSERCPTAHLQDMLVLNSFQPEYVFYEKNRTRPR